MVALKDFDCVISTELTIVVGTCCVGGVESDLVHKGCRSCVVYAAGAASVEELEGALAGATMRDLAVVVDRPVGEVVAERPAVSERSCFEGLWVPIR